MDDIHYLFVYGTLLQQAKHPMSAFLQKNSSYFGKGIMSGELYEISWYPGAIYRENTTNFVKGQIVTVPNPSFVFKILDEYEGSEYTRALCPVKFENKTINCWVYLYIAPVNQLKKIETGDFSAYLAQKSRG